MRWRAGRDDNEVGAAGTLAIDVAIEPDRHADDRQRPRGGGDKHFQSPIARPIWPQVFDAARSAV